ncbi:two-component system sensor histidine kinase-response regulator hybrid protein [Xanthomonas fragariae]|uniref:Two-component system sensor histidine kinase-response regulator hybrid protein n=1 Tax=Xanthomonas fragariae TaxID=48664 RepID=A0A1Y6HMI6_9XANT|nr:hypothetical protein BER92_15995 [Xanthomonas fragariae]AOD19352.1 hypothetical protein BER93_16040 [Xanthomonas fragariae]SMQ94104.1 two-component system sensor histidine kinase-response regulator hybrid protein [Xanthomonas fragariae]SMQ97969.1 hypothetical protein PD885_00706 [Xanthomonas fragariae]SMR04567.1 two-component system sensor histidine kinase-response regulator hybrid protein [Xanthomonas fragariae]
MSLNAFLPFINIAALARYGQKATYPVLLSTFVLMLLAAAAGYLSNPIHAYELLAILKQHDDHARHCAQTGQRGALPVATRRVICADDAAHVRCTWHRACAQTGGCLRHRCACDRFAA